MSPFAPALRSATRTVGRRQMSTGPTMHKAKDKWSELLSKRPPKDHLDEHLVFHPPFNGPAVALGLFVAFCAGYGSMGFGMMWQQKKQGFIK